MNTLPLAVRSPEAHLELDISLHAYTDSDIHVAQLVGILLNDIGGFDGEVSHADILQALGITTAVRAAMAEAAAKQGSDFSIEFLDSQIVSTRGETLSAARAQPQASKRVDRKQRPLASWR